MKSEQWASAGFAENIAGLGYAEGRHTELIYEQGGKAEVSLPYLFSGHLRGARAQGRGAIPAFLQNTTKGAYKGRFRSGVASSSQTAGVKVRGAWPEMAARWH